jgi:hypothetical protein
MTQTILRTMSGQPWSERYIIMITLKIDGAILVEDDKLLLPGAFTEEQIRKLVPNFPNFKLSIHHSH